MGVALADIAALSRTVVHEHGGRMDVIAVTATEGGTDRVEVFLTIGGCHREPCQFVVNVTRADRSRFEREFRGKLTDALQKHASAAT